MKTIKIFLVIVALFVCSCKRNCSIKPYSNLKPIDWENYNEPRVVTGNYSSASCKDMGYVGNIKVSGWLFQGSIYNDDKPKPIDPSLFALINNKEDIFQPNFQTKGGGIYIHPDGDTWDEYTGLVEALRTKFANVDLTKKCYIKGEIFLATRETNHCCYVSPQIIIKSIDDIYFENEEVEP
jgi:hypothetical protein